MSNVDEVYVMLMMMRADENANIVEGCTAEELLACIAGDNYDECVASCGSEEEEETTGNGLATVSKVSVPAAQEIPANATNVKVGTIKLTAGEYDTKVSSVEISRDGLATFGDMVDTDNDGTPDTVSNLQVALRWDNVETAYANVSKTTNIAKVKFSPALVVKAGKSETFDVVVQMPLNQNANNTHNFKVTNVVVSNWKAEWYPVNLWTIKTTSALSKTVDVTIKNGETPVKAWDTAKTLIKMDVDFSKAAWTLNRVTFLNTLTTATDKLWEAFDNLEAYVDGKKVWDVSLTDDKIIVSDLNISKKREETATLEIKADVVYSELTANFNFSVDSIDVSEDAYWMTPSAGSTLAQPGNIVVNGNNITFKKVNLDDKEVLPWTKNIVVANTTFKAATDTTIKTIQVTPSGTLSAAVLSADSAKLVVDGEEFEITDAQIIGGTMFAINTNVDVDANHTAKIQVILWTKIPNVATPETIKCDLKITHAVSTENTSVKYIDPATAATHKSVNGENVKIEEWKITLAAATVSAPVTRSLFSNKNQEVWRFSVKADWDKVTLKDLTLTLTTALAADDITALLDGNLSIVDANNTWDKLDWTIEFDSSDSSNKTILVKGLNYEIAEGETANLILMADLSKIDTTSIGKTLLFTVAGNSVKADTSIRNDISFATVQALSTAAYTLRITAPEITMTKASDNQFKVVIKNVDEDNAIDIKDLKYTVKATSNDSDFYNWTVVCLTEDVNATTCPGGSTAFGSPDTAITTAVTLAKNEEKIYYILVSWKYIEPDVLQTTISSLSYEKTTGTPVAESYNIVVK